MLGSVFGAAVAAPSGFDSIIWLRNYYCLSGDQSENYILNIHFKDINIFIPAGLNS